MATGTVQLLSGRRLHARRDHDVVEYLDDHGHIQVASQALADTFTSDSLLTRARAAVTIGRVARVRLGWYTAGAGLVTTAVLMAFGGVREDPWWLAFVAILATPTALAVLILWWRENRPAESTQQPDEESTGKPIDWGVGSALPPDAFTF